MATIYLAQPLLMLEEGRLARLLVALGLLVAVLLLLRWGRRGRF